MRELSDKLLQSKKYKSVCPETVRRILDECQARYKKPKDAEKAARERLHGITGAFLTPEEAARCRSALGDWREGGQKDSDLTRALACHASTRERLPLEATQAAYAAIFRLTGAPERVLDLACGINPLYLGAQGIEVLGIDISGTSVELINAARVDYGLPVRAECADLLCADALPNGRFDLALIFKALPLLERERAGSAMNLLSRIDAKFIAASFPTRTLGGRNIGMEQNYAAWMDAHLPENRRVAGKFSTDNELYYILQEK